MDVMNGDYQVTISAATKLAARQQVNQALGFIATLVQNGGLVQELAAQGTKFNAGNFIKVLFESTGYPYREDLFQEMTPQEMQAYQQMQAGPKPDVKNDLIKIHAQGTEKIRAQENNAENKALIEMQKHELERSMQNEFSQD
jgi:hypothetical protein